jgi:phospholipid-binding lipoprotein MlaA
MIGTSKMCRPLVLAGLLMASTVAPLSAQVAAPAGGQVAAPAGTPVTTSSVWDPLEQLNRGTYAFNAAFVAAVAAPVISAYRENVPTAVQTGLDNVFTNLREPLTVISSAVQGDFNNMGVSLGRFAINTTAGIGGVFDVATRMDWVSRPSDFGTAMCHYGVPQGPYIVLPFVGATSAREAAGTLAAYWLVYSATEDDILWSYIVADRVVAAASDLPLPPADAKVTVTPPATNATPSVTTTGMPSYEESRAHFATFREQLCTNALPATQLKASPLGGVIRIN